MRIQVTTLSENSASDSCLAEWGLSMLVEVDGLKILFDTGAGVAAVYNADLLGIDLATVDLMVMSHGHYDHTGGLREVLRRTGKKDIIAHPAVWDRKHGRMEGGPLRYVGIPFIREGLEVLGASFKLSSEPVKLVANVMTTGEIPMTTDYEMVEKYLFVKDNGDLKQDTLADDLALIIDTNLGLVLILGCAHRGIVNTLRYAQKLTGKERIYAAIGGTHLVYASTERLEKTAAALKDMGVQKLGVSHCTGFKALAYLAHVFGDRLFLNNSGMRFTLPFKDS